MARLGVALIAAACALWAAPARADLDRDVRDLGAAFEKSGAVRRLPARFVERGGLRPLLLPGEWLDPLKDDCITVVVLGSSSSTFVLRFLPTSDALTWPRGENPELSIAGGAQLVRCGIRKAMLSRLALEMRSPRGVIEVLVARGPRPFPPLTRVLPARSPGALGPPATAGPPARAEPIEGRLRAHTARARRDGAAAVAKRDMTADADGRGRALFELVPGCHRLTLLGAAGASLPTDLDADLMLGGDPEPAASDRSEATDAMVFACVGDKTIGTLSYRGATPQSSVTLLAEHYPLAEALPERWTADERARVSHVLWQHKSPRALAPVATARGVSGVTLMPLELDPSGCYLAVIASVRGQNAGVALSVELGERQAQNHGGPEGLGTALAFCARGEPVARFNLEVRGDGGAWLFSLFRAGKTAIGEQAE